MKAKNVAGFTLMEIVIAITLLAIIGVALATSTSAAITQKEIVQEISGRHHVVRQAMSRMVDEISMSFMSAHRQAPELRVKTGFMGEDEELHFTAFGHIPRQADAKQGDLRELSYYLGPDPRTGVESILRRIDVTVDDEYDDGGRVQTLLPDVVDLQFEYFDPTTEEWLDDWDIESTVTRDRLPSRVRITFTCRMPNDEEQTFTTQTKIWLQRPWAFRA